jgi:hypothetical protein
MHKKTNNFHKIALKLNQNFFNYFILKITPLKTLFCIKNVDAALKETVKYNLK